MQQLLSLYIRKKLEFQVEMERGGGGKSPKGSRHLQGKRKKESQKEKKIIVFIPHVYSSKGTAIFEI
jgi:hypothetical protein